MLVVDANVLLHVLNEDANEHSVAQEWFTAALSGSETVGFAWNVVLAVIRVSSHPALFPNPIEVEQVAREIDAWLGAAPAVIVHPTTRHLTHLERLLGRTGVGGNLVSDAHLAALALEHDGTVVSFDRDFGRFDSVRWLLPG